MILAIWYSLYDTRYMILTIWYSLYDTRKNISVSSASFILTLLTLLQLTMWSRYLILLAPPKGQMSVCLKKVGEQVIKASKGAEWQAKFQRCCSVGIFFQDCFYQCFCLSRYSGWLIWFSVWLVTLLGWIALEGWVGPIIQLHFWKNMTLILSNFCGR